jgi:hypothetical protein
MKQIEPISIWINGEIKVGEYFKVTGINDNYESYATNYWQIFSKILNENNEYVAGQMISDGNLNITGQDYIDWGNQPAMAINEWIYNWSASQLGLTII